MRPVPFDTCLKLIHQFEGKAGQFRPEPAQDPAGNWEIGWGHKLPGPSYGGSPINAAQADALAQADLTLAAEAVCTSLGTVVDSLTDNQYAALIDFTFNEGGEAFATSTLKRLILSGDPAGAKDQLAKWVYMHVDGQLVVAPGLVRRRAAEADLWDTP